MAILRDSVIARNASDAAILWVLLAARRDCFATTKAFASLMGWAPLAMTSNCIHTLSLVANSNNQAITAKALSNQYLSSNIRWHETPLSATTR